MIDLVKPENPSFILAGPEKVYFEDRPIPALTADYVLIRISYVGVCGSDVHFYNEGGIGPFKITQPLVLGHEASGIIAKLGPDVKHLQIGDRVAIEPGTPCRSCERCKEGKYHLCKDMVFAASPPYPGTLAKYYSLPEDFCYKLPDHVSLQEGVLVEPLSVAVHIVRQADVRPGQTVIVFGAGPVGLLTGIVAKAFGAIKIIAVDINPARLDFASKYCATGCFMPPKDVTAAEDVATRLVKEHDLGDGADVVLDASGAEASIRTGIYALRSGGTYVQGGLGKADINFPILVACAKEVNLKGSFRYGPGDYKLAVQMIASGQVSVKDLITSEVAFEDAEQGIVRMKEGKGIKTLIRGVVDERM